MIFLTNPVDEYIANLRKLDVEVHFSVGLTPETMRTTKVQKYSGDLLDISLHIWSDLRSFNKRTFDFDQDLRTGVAMAVEGLEPPDPRVLAIREIVYGYISRLNEPKNNAQWS